MIEQQILYSDLAIAADGTICCLYECGTENPYETLTLARFAIDDLLTPRKDES